MRESAIAPNCTFVEADAYNIARVVPQAVDHVFLGNAFHGVPDKLRLARAVYEILKTLNAPAASGRARRAPRRRTG